MAGWAAAHYPLKAATALAGHRSAWARLLMAPFCSSEAAPVARIAAKHPFEVDLEAGKRYAWCSCGFSKKQPFCDGSHKRAGQGFAPIRFVVEESKTAWLCGCKQTKTSPYCDGTHKEDFVQKA